MKKETAIINVIQYSGIDTPVHKVPTKAFKFDFPEMPEQSFYYVKGKAYNKTTYVLVEEKTGMEFCRGANLDELRDRAKDRLIRYGMNKIEQIIKDMTGKYEALPVIEPETISS